METHSNGWLQYEHASHTGNDADFQIKCLAHTGRKERTATLTFSATGVESKSVDIVQAGAEIVVNVANSPLTFPKEQKTMSLIGISNAAKLVVVRKSAENEGIPSEDIQFVGGTVKPEGGIMGPNILSNKTITPQSGLGEEAQYSYTLQIFVDNNPLITPRSAEYTIEAYNDDNQRVASKDFTISQDAGNAYLNVVAESNPLNFAAGGEQKEVSVESNTTWSVA